MCTPRADQLPALPAARLLPGLSNPHGLGLARRVLRTGTSGTSTEAVSTLAEKR